MKYQAESYEIADIQWFLTYKNNAFAKFNLLQTLKSVFALNVL